MKKKDDERVAEVFGKACNLPHEDRQQFLDEVCADEPERGCRSRSTPIVTD